MRAIFLRRRSRRSAEINLAACLADPSRRTRRFSSEPMKGNAEGSEKLVWPQSRHLRSEMAISARSLHRSEIRLMETIPSPATRFRSQCGISKEQVCWRCIRIPIGAVRKISFPQPQATTALTSGRRESITASTRMMPFTLPMNLPTRPSSMPYQIRSVRPAMCPAGDAMNCNGPNMPSRYGRTSSRRGSSTKHVWVIRDSVSTACNRTVTSM